MASSGKAGGVGGSNPFGPGPAWTVDNIVDHTAWAMRQQQQPERKSPEPKPTGWANPPPPSRDQLWKYLNASQPPSTGLARRAPK